ncbi:asparaginyl-tRNA synthetase [Gamsiella multidivaricata]|uniref:asparaginyl-tRNA synthetase n=1 Tax=Gamsiella multidivaricata TaxID=101098 RepID=UPI002220F7CE|nr:asparaginyl-tRNA synthetase [Gamsiella multidivaricata]KAI7829614.1 asparaginyl-tRNA synthetase [Gamsiella multidivaricata]
MTSTSSQSPIRIIPPALPNRTIKSILTSTEPGTSVKVQGWIRSARQQKHVTFLEVNDGSSLKGVQAILSGGQGKGLVAGTSVELEGTLVKSLGKEQALELQVSDMRVIGPCDGETYPLQKKRHSFEFLREISHLRSRAKTASAILRLRSASAWGFQKFFESQEFIQVHTPLLTTHDCEGGGEVFKIAPRISARAQQQALEEHQNQSNPTSSSTTTSGDKAANAIIAAPAPSDFFGSPVYLTVSGQLHLEIVASAISRVYTMGPVFRAEPSMTPRHLSEFWMLEAEIAFLDKLDHLLDFSEACLRETTRYLLENCADDIEFLNTWIDKSLKSRLTQLVEQPFARMTYTEAIEVLQRSGERFEFEPKWGQGLQSEHEKWLAGSHCKGPVFVTDYPAGLKPFYMRKNDEPAKAITSSGVEDRTTVGCVDLLVPGIGELMGGSLREERPEVLKKQLDEFGLDQEEYQWYMDLRKFGTVPHGGWGIGFERYILMVTGMDNVRDVIPFPRYNHHCKF